MANKVIREPNAAKVLASAAKVTAEALAKAVVEAAKVNAASAEAMSFQMASISGTLKGHVLSDETFFLRFEQKLDVMAQSQTEHHTETIQRLVKMETLNDGIPARVARLEAKSSMQAGALWVFGGLWSLVLVVISIFKWHS